MDVEPDGRSHGDSIGVAMEKLFEPIAINSMQLPHRIITGPMERGLANRDGSMTTRYIDYLSARAAGGAGLIQIESTYVDVRGKGHLFQVGCHDDSVVPMLRQATSAVHSKGGKLALELYMGGRQTPSGMSNRQPIAPSNVPCEVLVPTPIPREMSSSDIEDVIAKFISAAERAVSAGIDMVHIHGAHGYLIGSFVSPYSNRRTDRYGGSLTNRARFPLELVAALRHAVGSKFPLGYRLSADEFIPDGLSIDESKEFAAMLVDAGVDLIDVSGGIYESAHMIIQGVGSPVAPFLQLAKAIKTEVGGRAAVSVAQRLSEPEVALRVLDEGIDMVSLSRAFHADPEFANKLKSGNHRKIIPCVACHHCTDMLEANNPADCSVNPLTTRERFRGLERKSKIRSRVAVVGAGPGGIRAAIELSQAGHSVVLVEKHDRIGGQLLLASRVGDFDRFLDYAGERLRDLSIEMFLSTEADIPFLYEISADTIVVASGARGAPRSYDVVGDVETHDLFSAPLAIPQSWSGKVVLAGGDAASCAAAVQLAHPGLEIVIIEPGDGLAKDREPPGRSHLLRLLSAKEEIEVRLETTVELVGPGYVQLQFQGHYEELEEVSHVVTGGRQADNRLAEELRASGHPSVLTIGDAVYPRNLHAASLDAFRASALLDSGRAAVTLS